MYRKPRRWIERLPVRMKSGPLQAPPAFEVPERETPAKVEYGRIHAPRIHPDSEETYSMKNRTAAHLWIVALAMATIGGLDKNPWLIVGAILIGVVREEYL